MTNRKTLEQQIAQAQAEIQQRENRLKELLNKQKDKERKERNHRLCKRMGLIEKYLPDTITLTDEQFQAFIEETTANDYGRRRLAHIIAQWAEKHPSKLTEKATLQDNTANAKPAEATSSQSNPGTTKSAGTKPIVSVTAASAGNENKPKSG